MLFTVEVPAFLALSVLGRAFFVPPAAGSDFWAFCAVLLAGAGKAFNAPPAEGRAFCAPPAEGRAFFWPSWPALDLSSFFLGG